MHREVYKEAFNRIDELLRKDKTLLVAIDGNCGSGKSTLAKALQKEYDCNVFHMDHFFLQSKQKSKARLEEIGGNIDYLRFKEEIIDKVLKYIAFEYQIYDCALGELTDSISVSPKKLNIVEGVYSMHPSLIHAYDLKIFMTLDGETQKERILKRSGKAKLERFLKEWIPKENEYFTKFDILKRCDIVITSF